MAGPCYGPGFQGLRQINPIFIRLKDYPPILYSFLTTF